MVFAWFWVPHTGNSVTSVSTFLWPPRIRAHSDYYTLHKRELMYQNLFPNRLRIFFIIKYSIRCLWDSAANVLGRLGPCAKIKYIFSWQKKFTSQTWVNMKIFRISKIFKIFWPNFCLKFLKITKIQKSNSTGPFDLPYWSEIVCIFDFFADFPSFVSIFVCFFRFFFGVSEFLWIFILL